MSRGRPKGARQTIFLTVRISPEGFEKIKRVAVNYDLDISKSLRKIIFESNLSSNPPGSNNQKLAK